ncbi:hypothetical protein VAE122_420001 [Vibrio aestuarianus]|nr:hypothetical protein VAE122_420001 [Vibrio aestuarianus]
MSKTQYNSHQRTLAHSYLMSNKIYLLRLYLTFLLSLIYFSLKLYQLMIDNKHAFAP